MVVAAVLRLQEQAVLLAAVEAAVLQELEPRSSNPAAPVARWGQESIPVAEPNDRRGRSSRAVR